MKKLFSIVSVLLIMWVTVAEAQNNQNLTINVQGTRIKQIAVDDQTFSIDNTTNMDEKAVEIKDLSTGQHSLKLYRSWNSRYPTKSTFTLREGYKMNIAVNSAGSVSITEVMEKSGNGNTNMEDRMITPNLFNKLYKATKAKTTSSLRASYLKTQLAQLDRRMTSAQAKLLISLVNSESLRFTLAKQVYSLISDRDNFSLVSNLLSSSSNRAALENYIDTVPDDENETTTSNAAYVPMSQEKFNGIYNEVVAEGNSSDRNYYLNNFFEKDFNYFTSTQVRQLLQLVSSETERFNLAKTAYHGVTDRENYYNQISSLLNSSYNRSNLKSYITSFDQTNPNGNETGNTTGVKTPITSTAFNSLYQNIYYQNTTTKYNSINSAFTTSGNLFTTAQARQLIQLVTDESSRLSLAKAAYPNLSKRTDYALLNDLFSYQSSRNDFNAYVMNYNNGTVNNQNPGSGNISMGMSDTEFNDLYRKVGNAWSASNKYSLESDAFQNMNNRFTVFQARQLLMLLSTESEKLALAKMAYDNLVDQNNYAQMSDIFTNNENRTEWARYVMDVQNGGTGATSRTAMTDSEFRSVYLSMQFTFGFGAKYSSLQDLFNKETNYFTVSQVKQLIQLVSNESNRLDLAKLALNNTVDPANYPTLYDLFSSQTTRDELAAYVSANSSIR